MLKVLPNKEGHGPKINEWTNNDGSDGDFWRASNTLSQRMMGITTGTAVAKFDAHAATSPRSHAAKPVGAATSTAWS